MVNNSTQSKGSGNFFRSIVVWPLVFFAMSFAFFTWAAYDAVGTDFSNPRVVKFWKEGAEYAFITGFVLNVIRFVILSWEHARQQPDAVAARKAKEQAKSAERALQQKYKRRYAELPKHSKVSEVLACDNENRQLLIYKNRGGGYHCIDYNDVVSWQEDFGNLATARQGMIGIKTNVRQVDNAIVFTIRGDLGPTITLRLRAAVFRQQCFALLQANLS